MSRPPLRRRRARRLRPGRLLLLLLLAYVGGLVWFGLGLPTRVADETTTTDAIVVLTGGSYRLQTGFRLLEAGQARHLLVSGVHRGVEPAELLAIAPLRRDLLECCVTLGYEAEDTITNAAETAEWAAANRVQSLRLVTAGYHMPRAVLELSRSLPGVVIVPHPVFPPGFDLSRPTPGSLLLLLSEYNKLLGAWLRHLAADSLETVA
jgi:uncharacterized SAM-binding protein YcdF (DUF218 family)